MKTLLLAVTCVIIAAHDLCLCIDRKFEGGQPEESSEDSHQQTSPITASELARNSENVGEPTLNACLFDNMSETSMLSSSEADEFSLRRRSNESVNLDSRPLPCNNETDGSFPTRVIASQITESAGSFNYGNSLPQTFSGPSLTNLCETSNHLGLEMLNPPTSVNVCDFYSDVDLTGDFLLPQTSEFNEPLQIPDTSRNSIDSENFRPRSHEESESLSAREMNPSLVHRINGNDLTTGTESSSNMLNTTSGSIDIRSQNSTQVQISVALQHNVNLSEFQRHSSQNVASNFNPSNSEPGLGSIYHPSFNGDARNRVIHLLLQVSTPASRLLNDLTPNSSLGPLPPHWETRTESDFYSVSLPLNSSSRPLLHHWSTRSQFSCGLEAESARNNSALSSSIFSSLKEIFQTSRVGVVNTKSVGTNSTDRIRFSEDLTSDIDYLRTTLEEIARQFETESAARRVLLFRPTSVRHLLSEIEITLTEIIQHLPPSPISFRIAAEVLVTRALRRISTQRRSICSAAENLLPGSTGGTAEDSFRGIRRVIGIIMADLSFILALALPVLEQFDFDR